MHAYYKRRHFVLLGTSYNIDMRSLYTSSNELALLEVPRSCVTPTPARNYLADGKWQKPQIHSILTINGGDHNVGRAGKAWDGHWWSRSLKKNPSSPGNTRYVRHIHDRSGEKAFFVGILSQRFFLWSFNEICECFFCFNCSSWLSMTIKCCQCQRTYKTNKKM